MRFSSRCGFGLGFTLEGFSFFVEAIFRVPGMGQFFVLSMTGRDYPMIMAVVLVYGVFLATMNLVVDLVYGALDPRIRYQ